MQYVTPFVKSDFICKHTLLQLMWSLGLISFNRVAIFFSVSVDLTKLVQYVHA